MTNNTLNGNSAMTKPKFPLFGLVAFALVALIAASAFAAPQDNVFKRPGEDKKTEAAKGSTAKTTSSDAQATATTSVTKESTAKIEQQSDGWFTVVDDVAKVEVRLPSDPSYREVTFSPLKGRPSVVNHIHKSLFNKMIAVDYSWMDLHDKQEGKQLNKALDGAVTGAVANVFGQLDQMTKIKSGKVHGREFSFKFQFPTPDGKTLHFSGKSRIFIQANRQYQLNVIAPQGKENDELATKVFDSLIIKELE